MPRINPGLPASAGDWRAAVSGSQDPEVIRDLLGRAQGPGNGGGGEWQLAEGHYVPRFMEAHIVHPRPDAETGAEYVYRNAHPGLPWRLPICVQGGSWPFLYEVIDDGGATGLTVGAQYGDENYGIMSWADPQAGSYEVTVRVRDQEWDRGGGAASEVTATFTLSVGTSAFAFFDAANGSNSTGDGTLANPYQNFREWDSTDKDTAALAGKIAVHRAGTYTLDPTSPLMENGNRYAMGGNKPKVFMAYPGETVVFDFNGIKLEPYVGGATGTSHWAFVGIHCQGLDYSARSAAQFFRAATSRQLYFENIFEPAAANEVIGNNAAMLFSSGNQGSSQNIAFVGNEFRGLDGYPFWTTLGVHFGVFEGNRITGGYVGNAHGVFNKNHSPTHITVRGNVGIVDGISRPLLYGADGEHEWGPMEAVWNVWKSSSRCLWCNQPSGSPPGWYSARNTWISTAVPVTLTAEGPFNATLASNHTAERDVIVHDGTQTDGIQTDDAAKVTRSDLLTGVAADGIVDAEGKLQSSYRTNFLGTRGHEVA